MFVSHLSGFPSGIWGNYSLFQGNPTKAATPGACGSAQEVLGQLSEQLIQRQEQQPSLQDRVELRCASALEEIPTALSEISTDHLKFYASMLDCYARLNAPAERALTKFRDQLTIFDQTIQAYEEILAGNTALPENYTAQQIQSMLDLTREARAQYLQNGAKEVNRYLDNSQGLSEDDLLHRITAAALGEAEGYGEKTSGAWRIDPEAEDIYGEIDRALSRVSSLSQTCRRGISAIVAELERRGYANAPYMAHLRLLSQPPESGQPCTELSGILRHAWSAAREVLKERDSSI